MTRLCSTPGCTGKHKAHGLCQRCYLREYARRKYGKIPLLLVGPISTNRSGFKGVSFHASKKKWAADFRHQGKRYRLGEYKTKEEAARAYNAAVDRFFGDVPHYRNSV